MKKGKDKRGRRIPRKPRGGGKKRSKAAEKEKVHRHPLYGEIPLILRTRAAGTPHEYQTWDFDPDYRPEMPPGAVRGDVRKQAFCSMCHTPRYFYVDLEKTCVQCGEDFVFGAAEQRFWYEALRFHFDSKAIRCPSCRRLQRSIRALQRQIAAGREAVRRDPDDPAHLLSLAEALIRYHQRKGEGNLEEAVALARKAGKLWPENAEPQFWEGLALGRAGHGAKGREVLEVFLGRARKGRRRYRGKLKEAEEIVRLASE